MPDPELTEQEEKYFETQGEAELPVDDAPEQEVSEEAPPTEDVSPTEEAAPAEEEPKVVPLQALHEAREEAKRLRERLESKDADFNKLEGRLDVLQRLAQQEQPTESINWDEMPIDAGKATTQRIESVEQMLMRQQEEQQLNAVVSSHEAAFRAETPDYDHALAHLQQARVKELQVFGLDQPSIMQQLKTEAYQLAATAIQNGLNPAQVVYQLAEARGYTKEVPIHVEQKAEEPKADPAKQMETIERGQKAAVSTAAATGTPPAKNTLETLMDMDDDDFAKVAEGDWKRLWQ